MSFWGFFYFGIICGIALVLLSGAKRGHPLKRGLCIVFGLLIGAFALTYLRELTKSTDLSSNSVASAGCAENYKACKDNEDMINYFHGMSRAKAACKAAVQSANRYGTPDFPFIAFGTFFVGDDYPKTGDVRLREDEAKIQNEYGTQVTTSISCAYNFPTGKVISAYSENNSLIRFFDRDASEQANNLAEAERAAASSHDERPASSPILASASHVVDSPPVDVHSPVAPLADLEASTVVANPSTGDLGADPGMPADVKALADAEFKLDDRCRDGSGDDVKTRTACDEREKLLPMIRARGWCWGHADDADYQRTWVRCRPGDD